jgi:hypothetical protein
MKSSLIQKCTDLHYQPSYLSKEIKLYIEIGNLTKLGMYRTSKRSSKRSKTQAGKNKAYGQGVEN